MRAFGINLRRSSTILGGLLIAGIDVWLALSARAPGLNLWSDLVTGLSSASLYTGTVAAGFVAFEASRWAAAADDRLRSSARSPIAVRSMHAGTVIAPIILGYMASLVVLGAYAAITNTYGVPYGPWLTAFGGALLAASAFGYLVGRLIGNRWYVAPAAALLFYGLFVIVRIAPLPFWVKSLYPVITYTDSVFVDHLASTMWGQVALFCALAVALILLVAGGRDGTRARLALGGGVAACAAVIVFGVSVVAGTGGQYTTGHNSRDFACTSNGVTICLNRGYSAAMIPLQRQFNQLNARAAGTPLTATRLEQNVEGIGDDPQQGARSVYVEQIGGEIDMEFAAFRYAMKYGGTQACINVGDGESPLAVAYVDSWLSGYATDSGDLPGLEHYRALTSLPTSDANAWFRTHANEYFACTLKLDDLP